MPGVLGGRAALVSGTSGIGEAVAIALVGREQTSPWARDGTDRLEQLARRIEIAGGTALALPGDVTVESVARGLVADTVRRFGRIDILITLLASSNSVPWKTPTSPNGGSPCHLRVQFLCHEQACVDPPGHGKTSADNAFS